MIGRSKVFPVTDPRCLKRIALNVRILLFAEHSRVELSLSPALEQPWNRGLSILLHSREMKLLLGAIFNIHIFRVSNMVKKDSVQAVWEER